MSCGAAPVTSHLFKKSTCGDVLFVAAAVLRPRWDWVAPCRLWRHLVSCGDTSVPSTGQRSGPQCITESTDPCRNIFSSHEETVRLKSDQPHCGSQRLPVTIAEARLPGPCSSPSFSPSMEGNWWVHWRPRGPLGCSEASDQGRRACDLGGSWPTQPAKQTVGNVAMEAIVAITAQTALDCDLALFGSRRRSGTRRPTQ